MEMPDRLRAIFGGPGDERQSALRVVLADHKPQVEAARPSILQALQSQRIDICTDVVIAAIDERGATLASGERIAARTVVWCAGMPLLALRIERCVTVLDLGPWGAIYLAGWERRVASVGADAKRTKQTINHERIYPPRSRDRRQILDAAEPTVQAAPMLAGGAAP